jgi:dihydropteroate synthase
MMPSVVSFTLNTSHGYSMRLGAARVSPDEEKNHVVPVIAGICTLPPPDNATIGKTNVPLISISVDTLRLDIACAAVAGR